MNWFRENPFISILVAVTLILCGVLYYFLNGKMEEYNSVKRNYEMQVKKLQSLQNHDPFPSQENLDKVIAMRDAYVKALEAYKKELSAFVVPIDSSVTPQNFQDMLSRERTKTFERAAAAKVTLPQNFSFGFDYLTAPPSAAAAPALARQLNVIARVINDLIGDSPETAKISSLDSIERPRLVEEGGGAAPAATPRPQPQGRRGGGGAAAAEDSTASATYKAIPFTIAFTADQGKFRLAFNEIVRSNPFLVVRSLIIKNTQPNAPAVASESSGGGFGGGFAPSSPPPTEEKSEEDKEATSMDIIFGREKVTVEMLIDFIDFQLPQPGQEEK